MDLLALGWTAARHPQLPPGCTPARVARVDRGRLTVLDDSGERHAVPAQALYADEPTGPAVGDWVALRGELAVAVLPRTSAFVRTGAGRTSEAQVVAANLELVLVVDALTVDPRLRRVERYLAVAWSSGATPVVVLTKADLCDDVAAAVQAVREDALGVDVVPVSARTGANLDEVRALLPPGRTAAMVGPSGVGKSSLLNALAGETVSGTREIRDDGRGRHTTTARELHVLPGGALLVDTPGMRELALYDDAQGVEAIYGDIAELAEHCRFRDCEHRSEPGCAVAAALDDGRLDPARFNGWRKLHAEAHRQQLRVDARLRAQERARLRSFSRAMRETPKKLR